MKPFQSDLLRRTAMALAAVASFSITTLPQAATVTLSGATGNTCTYSAMSVQPDGSFSVSCTGGTTTPTPPTPPSTNPGAVSLSAVGSALPNADATMTINRIGGSYGSASVSYASSGDGCAAASGGVQWGDGDGASKTFTIHANAAGTCTVYIGGNVNVSLGSPAVIAFGISSTPVAPPVTPPVAPPTGQCPTGFTAPVDMAVQSLGGLGNPLLSMVHSGQVVTMTLPATQPGSSSGQVSFSESAGGAYTPQPVTLTISINKCPGLIDTDANNRCNLTSTNGNYNSISWFSKAYSVITDAAKSNLRGYCWAPASEGPWYVNAKWTYGQCAFGAQVCGFAIQQNYGPY